MYIRGCICINSASSFFIERRNLIMLKKTITYTDFNGVERTEDFYFNLTKTELMNWHLTTAGGMYELLMQIINSKDQVEMIKYFQEVIKKAYGEKSADGKRLIKHDENGKPLVNNFMETNAYDQLYMELVMNDKAAAEFINGLMPQDLATKASEMQKNGQLPQLPKQN